MYYLFSSRSGLWTHDSSLTVSMWQNGVAEFRIPSLLPLFTSPLCTWVRGLTGEGVREHICRHVITVNWSLSPEHILPVFHFSLQILLFYVFFTCLYWWYHFTSSLSRAFCCASIFYLSVFCFSCCYLQVLVLSVSPITIWHASSTSNAEERKSA